MSVDSGDLVDALLDEQARVNAAVDQGDINDLVADYQQLLGETIGLLETLNRLETAPPHSWGDGQTQWGFFSWAKALTPAARFIAIRYVLMSGKPPHSWADGQSPWGGFNWAKAGDPAARFFGMRFRCS